MEENSINNEQLEPIDLGEDMHEAENGNEQSYASKKTLKKKFLQFISPRKKNNTASNAPSARTTTRVVHKKSASVLGIRKPRVEKVADVIKLRTVQDGLVKDLIRDVNYNQRQIKEFERQLSDLISLINPIARRGLFSVEQVLASGPLDEVLLYSGDVEVTRDDLRCLLPGKWLKETVINAYLEFIVSTSQKRDVAGIPCLLMKLLRDKNDAKIEELLKNRYSELSAIRTILVPINLNNSHWILGVVKRESSSDFTCYVIDSFDTQRPGEMDLLEYFIKKFIACETKCQVKRVYECYQRQHNGYDCGVFTCRNAAYWLNYPQAYVETDMNDYRVHVFDSLFPYCLLKK